MIGSQRVTLRTRVSTCGSPAEITIEALVAAGRRNWMANDIAVAISLGLQHGVPLDQYVNAFTGRASAIGLSSTQLRASSEITEHLFQKLGMAYLGRHEAGDDALQYGGGQ